MSNEQYINERLQSDAGNSDQTHLLVSFGIVLAAFATFCLFF